ncbi:MAG: hypothetical protein R3C19_24300 [Planctomycetaceae bacterium]
MKTYNGDDAADFKRMLDERPSEKRRLVKVQQRYLEVMKKKQDRNEAGPTQMASLPSPLIPADRSPSMFNVTAIFVTGLALLLVGTWAAFRRR